MDTPMFRTTSHQPTGGSTLFERMRQTTQAAPETVTGSEIPTHFSQSSSAQRGVVLVEVEAPAADRDIRFERATVDEQPGIVMQERTADGSWQQVWSLPTQSVDAREGMFGWLNTQSHRWDRFARMLQRRGPDELTSWIFELMVQPTAAAARPPRVEMQPFVTIDQYRSQSATHAFRYASGARVDNCICRRNPRDF